MRRSKLGQVVSGTIMAAAATVPVATIYEILTHLPASGNAFAASQTTSTSASSSPSASTNASSNRQGQPSSSNPTNTKSSTSPSTKPKKTSSSAGSQSTQTFTGPAVQDQFGTVQAVITVKNRRIADVQITAPMDNPRSAGINSQAVPMLQQETLQAQSASGVNLVSGATLTSEAYQQSLQAAISQAQSASVL